MSASSSKTTTHRRTGDAAGQKTFFQFASCEDGGWSVQSTRDVCRLAWLTVALDRANREILRIASERKETEALKLRPGGLCLPRPPMGGDGLEKLYRQQEAFAQSFEALSAAYEGIAAAIKDLGVDINGSLNGSSGHGGETALALRADKAGVQGHTEKFELSADGVPNMTTRAPKGRNTVFGKRQRSESAFPPQKGMRLLDDWSESFVVSEQDATMMYNHLYGCMKGTKTTTAAKTHSSVHELGLQGYVENVNWSYTWQILTLILVAADTMLIPVTLAWPDTDIRILLLYFQVAPAFWIFDILFNVVIPLWFAKGVLRDKLQILRPYVCRRLPIDASLVTLDLLLLGRVLPEDFRIFSLLRLIRLTKMRKILAAFESRLAARGNIKLTQYLIILQCIAQVLTVNHVLACTIFYVGRIGQLREWANWIDRYNALEHGGFLQYMMCFNWVIAEYTPAPWPYQAQNELEQTMIIIIILTCLPLLGAQIGKIGGTLNMMKEKAKERDMVRRDLQRWLVKTSAPEKLTRRMLESLDDVLGSADSPLDVKEPMALKFLPSTLLEELRVVKTGEKLSKHQLFTMLMDDRVGISGPLSSAFRTVSVVQGEQVFSFSRKAEGLYITLGGKFLLHYGKGFVKKEVEGGVVSVRSSLSSRKEESGEILPAGSWLAELSLYANMTHSAAVSARAYSKILMIPVSGFVKAVRESPAAVVAVHEKYAVRLLSLYQTKQFSSEDTWELLPDEMVEESVSNTQLSELLMPGSGRMHNFKSSEETDFTNFLDEVMDKALSNEEVIESIKKRIPELRPDGLYSQLNFEEEGDRAILSMLSTLWILKDQYQDMVDCQRMTQRLTDKTFKAIQEFIGAKRMNKAQLTAILVLLALRGLSKSSDFSKLCPPSERRNPEQVLSYAICNLDAYLPSIACLGPETYTYVVNTVRMLSEFNFAQLLQGENNPHSVWQLQASLQEEGETTFQMFLFIQVSILCGVTSHITMRGSMFLNELNGRSVVKGLVCLQDILETQTHRRCTGGISPVALMR
ncbi:unnamed protein product [Effrenium voratum]|nr:unnamed protein product [Effrenium voratum]